MPFKIFGYSDKGLPIEEITSEELAEITLVASASDLREIGSFLQHAAEEIESKGSSFGHLHLSDLKPIFKSSPHFVVFQPESSS